MSLWRSVVVHATFRSAISCAKSTRPSSRGGFARLGNVCVMLLVMILWRQEKRLLTRFVSEMAVQGVFFVRVDEATSGDKKLSAN